MPTGWCWRPIEFTLVIIYIIMSETELYMEAWLHSWDAEYWGIFNFTSFNLFCHLSFGSLSVVGITYKNWIHANVMQCIWNCSVSTLRLLNLHISFSLELSDVHGYLTIILEACATHISIMGDNSTLSSPAFFHILNHLRNFVCHPVMPVGCPFIILSWWFSALLSSCGHQVVAFLVKVVIASVFIFSVCNAWCLACETGFCMINQSPLAIATVEMWLPLLISFGNELWSKYQVCNCVCLYDIWHISCTYNINLWA